MITSDKRSLGGPFDSPSYGDPVSNAMWDMPWIWDEKDDPHPGLEMLTKANTITRPNEAFGKQAKPLMPHASGFRINNDSIMSIGKTSNNTFDIFKPSADSNEDGLISNFSEKDNAALANQIGNAIFAGKNTEGQRLTDQYYQLNPYRDQRLIRTDETLLDARKQIEPVVAPRLGTALIQQGVSSIASDRYNEGLEYLPAMQRYLQKGHTEGIQASNEAEADFSYQLAGKAANMISDVYGKHHAAVADSIDGAESSFQKHYPENPQYYEMLPQHLVDPGALAVEGMESHSEINDDDKKIADYWKGAAKVGAMKNIGLAAETLSNINAALPKKDILIKDQKAFDEQIENNKKKIREMKEKMISITQVKSEDPAETWLNLRRLCYETVLGEYALETAMAIATRGKSAEVIRAAKIMNAAANYSRKNEDNPDSIKNAKINSQFRFGKDESAAHARLNQMADQLDQSSSTAVKFLIKILPDVKREEYLELIENLQKDW